MQQVAERAGVSSMTVSNVLRGRAGQMADETRDRVLSAVRELKYIPVATVKQSRHIETRVLGVVFDEIDASQDDWGLMTLKGLRQGALELGYDLLLMLRPAPDWAVGREEAQFMDRRSDGLIFVAPKERDGVLGVLVEHGMPLVVCHDTAVPAGVGHVVADNHGAARLATEYLVSLGHTRIAYISGGLEKSYFQHRLQGFLAAMAQAGLGPSAVLDSINSERPFPLRDDLRQVMASAATAVVCGNDVTALELRRLARAEGLDIPEGLSVMGIDGVIAAEKAGLSTVDVNTSEIGRLAIHALCEIIQGKNSQECHRTVPAALLPGRTVRSLAWEAKSAGEPTL